MNIPDEGRDLGHDLKCAVPVESAHLELLHARLAAAAAHEGLLDIAYRTLDTPVGTLLLAATEHGMVRVAYPSQNHDDVLQDLADRIGPRVLCAPARLDAAAVELEEYFTGRRTRFELPLDWRLSKGFRADVLHCLAADLPFGKTASYGTVAELVGNPKAVRAVGTACATNPLPIIVPCHRVVRSDGSMGGYVGGAEAKRALLTLEAAA